MSVFRFSISHQRSHLLSVHSSTPTVFSGPNFWSHNFDFAVENVLRSEHFCAAISKSLRSNSFSTRLFSGRKFFEECLPRKV